ncbi:reverse transcriptase domain-containing protein [Tanacetum coccineum]|uniref:Reverse transcriptase domain-containing protein n=1 Tax=Tanacetum coccineum TaxID=301880 RepID=A0ABQ4YFJ9_9ASTR
MLAIFHDMIEESVEVFMDDFSVFGDSFDKCLNNLDKMLQRCKDAHLVLNWEKCHFMIKEGIVLGHKVSGAGLEVDKAKINVISKLTPSTNIKEFDIEIKDRKVTKNFAADHLSQIENEEISNDSEVDDNFPGETLMEINTRDEPWFEDFANYLVANIIPKGMTYQQKNKFFSDLKHFLWEEPYLFKNAQSSNQRPSGQVENTNIALKRIIEKTVKDNIAIWSRKLDDALWAFRIAYKTPTGTTPYKLIYGKNCHLPFEIEHRAYWALKNCNPDLIAAGEKRMFQLHELDKLRHQAYENSRLYKEKTKVWHDRRLRMRKEFKHENKVLLFHSKYKFKQPKLKPRWLGPYIVKHQYPSRYVELYGKDGKTFIVNGHRLKLYHEEEDYNDQRESVTPFFPQE